MLEEAARWEAERLAALHRLELLDTPPEPFFDRMTRLASDLFGTPISVVSLIDAERQWFKSSVGMQTNETPREVSFCAHAIHQPQEVMVVPDATLDGRFAQNRVVTGPPYVRFYAGAPIFSPDGHPLGTLCVVDTGPRASFMAEDVHRLAEMAAIVSDHISARRLVGEVDGVTGLPNRFRLLADLRPIPGQPPKASHLAVVDAVTPQAHARMARVLGHGSADLLVQAAAQQLRHAVPAGQPLYQLDACRFCVTLQAVDDSGALAQARKLTARLAAAPPVSCSGVPVLLRPNVGVARLPDRAIDHPQAIRMAISAALSPRAVQKGWALHDCHEDEAQARAFLLITSLEAALAAGGDGQFRLAWQPRVNLQVPGRCEAVEALLRWRHPLLGEISPGEFIPLAESTSLMPRLTDMVLRMALDQLRLWRGAGLPRLTAAVNISARDIDDEALLGRVTSALQVAALDDPGLLELELTETAAVEDLALVSRRLAQLRSLGVGVALDDFGAGHSNLVYLRQIPATVAKLDRQLVAPAAKEAGGQAVVMAITTLLQELGLRVVAEGIETGEDAEAMRACGCDEGQGYYFTRPMEAGAFRNWLAGRVVR